MTAYFHYLIVLLAAMLGIPHGATNQYTVPYKTDIPSLWKTVDSLEQRGLYERADKLLTEQLLVLSSETYPYDWVRARIYKARYLDLMNDQPELKGVYYIREALQERSLVNTPDGRIQTRILQSVLAEYYKTYLMNNQWSLSGRADTGDAVSADSIEYWPGTRFIQEANTLYLKSVDNLKDLKAIKLKDMPSLVSLQKEGIPMMDDLHDLLAYRALIHFFDGRSFLGLPAAIDDFSAVELFEIYENFARVDLTELRGESMFLTGLRLYQKMFNDLKSNQHLTVYLDIKRLQLVHEYSHHDDKGKLFEDALNQLFKRFAKDDVGNYAAYVLAEHWIKLGAEYQPLDSATHDKQWKIKEALELINSQLEKHPNSLYAGMLKHQASLIKAPSLELNIEELLHPGDPILVSLRYKNTDKTQVRFYKLSYEQYEQFLRLRSNQHASFLEKLGVYRSDDLSLVKTDDFQQHRIEFSLSGLDAGLYLVTVDTNLLIQGTNRTQRPQLVFVSDLEVFSRALPTEEIQVWVVNRKTACPEEGVDVIIRERAGYQDQIGTQRILKTDKNGTVKFKPTDTWNYRYIVKKGEQYSSPKSMPWSQRDFSDSRDLINFFTDRAIYRPGQMVHFKGLMTRIEQHVNARILPGENITVVLKDANYQVVAEYKTSTNDFGTFSGHFVLPKGLLTGRFSMEIKENRNINAYHAIQVEEYKRPSFYVEIDQPQSTYKLGDSVLLSGKASMYSGPPLAEANGTFTVRRIVNFPWMPWWRIPPMSDNEAIIEQGKVNCDDEGRFEITFLAKGQAEKLRKWRPVYHFEINVDITDKNGETRSQTHSISIGTVPYQASIDIPEYVWNDEKLMLNFDITNLAGVSQAIDAQIQIFELKAPERYLKSRLWERPDLQNITEAQFKKLFPNRPFRDENELQQFSRLKQVAQYNVNPTLSKTVELSDQTKAGLYLAVLTLMHNGEKLEVERVFHVMDRSFKGIPINQNPLILLADKREYQPGQTATIFVSNPYGKSCMQIAVEKEGKLIRNGWQEVNKHFKFEVPITDTDYGGVFVHVFLVHEGRSFVRQLELKVPRYYAMATIHKHSMRDVLSPGSEEQWTFRIDKKDGKIGGPYEVIASMYDQSLDYFLGHQWPSLWVPPIRTKFRTQSSGLAEGFISLSSIFKESQEGNPVFPYYFPDLDHKMMGYTYHGGIRMRSGRYAEMDGGVLSKSEAPSMAVAEGALMEQDNIADPRPNGEDINHKAPEPKLSIRENLNETVFFYPQILTDQEGNFELFFKMNEALTRWRLMIFAHDKNLASAYAEYMVETRKDLMVFPNVPRFLRQNDQIGMSCKVQNMTEKEIQVTTSLLIKDLVSGRDLSSWFTDGTNASTMSLPAGKSQDWNPMIEVPDDYFGLVELIYTATSGEHTDAERHVIPILTNRKLVTESLPLWVNERQNRTFTFESYKKALQSSTLKTHQLTLEYTPNPAWYALQALPYMEADAQKSITSRMNALYANAIGHHMSSKYPKLKDYFGQWQESGALMSELEKNPELKSAVLQETPWVLNAKSEREQRNNIALLFDINRQSSHYAANIQYLKANQGSSGGFPWFPGGRESVYITQFILEKLGHLDKLGVKDIRENPELRGILMSAIRYCDQQFLEEYNRAKRRLEQNKSSWKAGDLSIVNLHYLYVRSFFMDIPRSEALRKAMEDCFDIGYKQYLNLGRFDQSLLSLALHRNMRGKEAKVIMETMLGQSVYNEEMGRFWRLEKSWFWYQQPVETHVTIMEAVREILGEDHRSVNELKRWLLKQKQTTHWPNSTGTAKAIYILLMDNSDWIAESPEFRIVLSGQELMIPGELQSPGTMYFKMALDASQFTPAKPEISLENKTAVPAWGGIYWQYFEQLDKITSFVETPLRIQKKLWKKTLESGGAKLKAISDNDEVMVGDVITVRIELRVDRAMEFVHLKDMRASALEPVENLSGYRWRSGVGYYMNVRDQAVDFFFDYLAPGTYVFEYDLRVFHKGNFSNGICTIQSIYAPEFTSHSAGIRFQSLDQK